MKKWDNTPLKFNERKAIQKAVNTLKMKFPIERVILYGSKARGESDVYSDIDLLIICSEQISWREEKAISDLLFDIGMEYDVIFSPLFSSKDEWNGGVFTSFPIYSEIMKDGAVVHWLRKFLLDTGLKKPMKIWNRLPTILHPADITMLLAILISRVFMPFPPF